MKALKPVMTLAGAIAAVALSGTTAASHQDWENWPPRESVSPRHVIVPPQPAIVGYVATPPAYYYEPAPRSYYYEPAQAYYYERAPAVSYYYNYDDSAFPRSNSRD
ncbi:MAG: hypothetical protein ACT4P8_07910 [Betaproteobacteria bacterium]